MKTQYKFISVLSALLLSVTAFSQTLADARRLTDNEQYEQAKSAYKKLIAADPTNGDNYFYFGDLMLRAEDPDSAKLLFKKGIAINATDPLVHIGLAKYYYTTGKADSASQELTYAKSIIATEVGKKGSPMTPQRQVIMDLEIAKTMITAAMPDYDGAAALCDQATKLDPKDPEVQLVKGDVLFKKDPVNATPSINCYIAASKLDAKSNKAYLRIGQIYYNGKNFHAAISNYNKALSIDSTFAPAYRLRGEAQFSLAHYDSAVVSYQKYLKLNNDVYARYRYCAVLYKTKKYDDAISEGFKVLGEDSSYVVVYRIIARCYTEMPAPDANKGMQYFNLFFIKQKQYGHPAIIVDDYYYRGKCYSKLKQDSMAVLDYQQAMKVDTNRKDIYFDIGGCYYVMGKYDLAAAAYQAKITALGTRATMADYNALGLSLYLNKDYLHSDSAYRKMTIMDPKNRLGWLGRGRCNAVLDPQIKSDSARKFYETYWDLAIGDKVKNKSDLVTAGKYLGIYHETKKNLPCAKAYFLAVYDIDNTQTDAKKEADVTLKATTAADITTCRLPQ
ncbi:MAG TPA: tetratricopeptide repeat protein [Bacteroidia bacterium]|nr:tetratricopeptide repeat protein [Bacteroidia bacterium]